MVKMLGTIAGQYCGFSFEIPKGTVCELIKIVGDVVYVSWEDEIATIFKRYVEFL